jgi:hypothetical protein
MSYTLHTDKSWQATMRELSDTMSKWGIKEWDTNYPKGARLEGMRQTEEDRMVHLTYQKDGRPVNLTMGKQARAVDNLRVLYLAVEAMRLNEKRGLGEVIQEAYLQLAGPIDSIGNTTVPVSGRSRGWSIANARSMLHASSSGEGEVLPPTLF